MAIEVGSIGYNHRHDKDYYAQFPEGPGAYLFLLVKSDSVFTINGKVRTVSKNSYIIINPKTPCFYKGAKGNYTDDWFFFWLSEDDKAFLIKNGIAFDTPVHLEEIEQLSTLIHRIAFEHFSGDRFHTEIKNSYTQIFFYQLIRIANSSEVVSSDLLSAKNEKLIYLRTKLFQDPLYFNSVDDMAAFMNLSRSGFQHLYSSVFGHSVIKDVISGRIEKAREYLRSSNLTILEISSRCGYKSEYHFMRQFKQQTGFTPTEFRNSDTWNQIEEARC